MRSEVDGQAVAPGGPAEGPAPSCGAPGEDLRVLLDAVIASDRRYFAAGADAQPLPGAVLLHLPGSAGVGAGTVVWVDDPAAVATSGDWVGQAAQAAAERGAPTLRVYGLPDDGPAADALAAAGLVARHELAYVGPAERTAPCIDLRPARGPEGRSARRRVAGSATTAPDGHPVEAERFLAGEERRAASGDLDLFVAWEGGEPVAVVGALRSDGLLRLKNLLVRPDRRRRHLAARVTSTMLGWAAEEGRTLGTVALEGEPGERIYRSLGMTIAGRYTEWSVGLTTRRSSAGDPEPAP